jgi:hypothetical protein
LSCNIAPFFRSGYTRERHRHFLFSVPNCRTEFLTFLHFPVFSSRVLPAFELFLRARLYTCRKASAEGGCGEHGIGGSGKYCDDKDAQLGRINVFYYETLGGKYSTCPA